MNISTYEARIAALEAQLGPEPGPSGPTTGLVSVVVTPDITLSDGTSLNARLAAEMPIEPGKTKTIDRLRSNSMEQTYQITVTPGPAWKAFSNPNGTPTFGQVGEPFTAEFDARSDGLGFVAGAAAPDFNPAEGQPLPEQFCNTTVSVTRV